jgi:hypothetical protein
MKASFTFDHNKAVELCKKYSDKPEVLEKLIEKWENDFVVEGGTQVMPSTFSKDLKCLSYHVTIKGFSFPFHGSHHDAMIVSGQNVDGRDTDYWKQVRKNKVEREKIRDSVMYSILCSIKSDLYILNEEPEDIGMNPDSIKDMARWNELKEHARKLSQALKLTSEEMESLPS